MRLSTLPATTVSSTLAPDMWWVWRSRRTENLQEKPLEQTRSNVTFLPQTPHDYISVQTQTVSVGNRRLISWITAWLNCPVSSATSAWTDLQFLIRHCFMVGNRSTAIAYNESI
jgi:hypothetical protein